MKPLIKRTLVILAVPAVIIAGYGLYRGACIGTAYMAKTLCSGVFVAKRTPEAVLSQDFGSVRTKELKAASWQQKRPGH